jgi:hypothetical protein
MTEPRTETQRPQRGTWDFLLVMITVGLLGTLGAQSLVGTLYSWWAYRTQPGWEQIGHPGFVQAMNLFAAPLVVALVVVMGLCVPRRLLARRTLAIVSAGMVVVGVAAGLLTRSLAIGLGVYLVEAGLIQVAVVVLTLAGAAGLGYLSHGRVAKAGSGLLHLGFIVFALVVVALQKSPAMLPVFAVATVLLVVGSALAFYARPTPAERDSAEG